MSKCLSVDPKYLLDRQHAYVNSASNVIAAQDITISSATLGLGFEFPLTVGFADVMLRRGPMRHWPTRKPAAAREVVAIDLVYDGAGDQNSETSGGSIAYEMKCSYVPQTFDNSACGIVHCRMRQAASVVVRCTHNHLVRCVRVDFTKENPRFFSLAGADLRQANGTGGEKMSFVTITTWRMVSETETLQHVKGLMSRKYFPGLLALGAQHSMLVDADLDRFAIVTIYPSRKVRDDAIAHISALRGEGAEEFGAELMDAYAGEMLASSDD